MFPFASIALEDEKVQKLPRYRGKYVVLEASILQVLSPNTFHSQISLLALKIQGTAQKTPFPLKPVTFHDI
jgi:hypothetical protein